MTTDPLNLAAQAVAGAQALILTAGAGMGVDSGLPDFRGTEGFWKAYPAYAKLGIPFEELANPRWFREDPALAWGFYGHRLNLYRATQPHEGYSILKRWVEKMSHGAFVFTSNVDGAFQKMGFDPDRILEVHGTIHHMQCLRNCGVGLFPSEQAAPGEILIDKETFRASDPLPKCPKCGSLARPNILMFGDGGWDESLAYEQEVRQTLWFGTLARVRVVVIECGAGMAVPTVRRYSEAVARKFDATLIRLNLRDPGVPPGHIGLPMSALAGLREIEARM